MRLNNKRINDNDMMMSYSFKKCIDSFSQYEHLKKFIRERKATPLKSLIFNFLFESNSLLLIRQAKGRPSQRVTGILGFTQQIVNCS